MVESDRDKREQQKVGRRRKWRKRGKGGKRKWRRTWEGRGWDIGGEGEGGFGAESCTTGFSWGGGYSPGRTETFCGLIPRSKPFGSDWRRGGGASNETPAGGEALALQVEE